MKRLITALALATLVAAGPAAAFQPGDPLAAKQWYLQQDRAFDAWPDAPPTTLLPVRVAIVDSGIDGTHPELRDRVVAGKSFVGTPWNVDTEGHGTFLAGEIAPALDDKGMVGMAYLAELVIAKVVRQDGVIPIQAEADAIRWAADQGARVINLSLGGLRDPADPARDVYSPLEAAAVAYAYRKGALVVASVGNGDEAPRTPWRFASYPAALPHVLGVSALTKSGAVPDFSNRDPIYNDIAAPGQDLFSTFPYAMTARRPTCSDQGYSDCGSDDYHHAEGTSFAAPQVTAAAAMLLSILPSLTPDQLSALLEQNADDVTASTGCLPCTPGHDPYSGWGRLDVARAVDVVQHAANGEGGLLPPKDRDETNDDAGSSSWPLYGFRPKVKATLDYYDDAVDVYRVFLRPGQRLSAHLDGPENANTNLVLWKPGTERIDDVKTQLRAAQSVKPGSVEQLAYRATRGGWYYVEARITTPGFGPYTLTLTKSATSK
ncbi:MAG TPA: S8 family serine peptidase [Gaiellaceae bacterium]|jgi:subtilisin family serine protease